MNVNNFTIAVNSPLIAEARVALDLLQVAADNAITALAAVGIDADVAICTKEALI